MKVTTVGNVTAAKLNVVRCWRGANRRLIATSDAGALASSSVRTEHRVSYWMDFHEI